MQDEVIGRMKEVFQRYDLKFTVPFEMPANLSEQQKDSVALAVERSFGEYEKQLHDLTSRVLFERLLIEIELYKLRYDSENTSGDQR